MTTGIDLHLLLQELAPLLGGALIQAWLSVTLKKIEDDRDMNDDAKRNVALRLIEAAIKKERSARGRLFFNSSKTIGNDLVNSVAVEAIHNWYLTKCSVIHNAGSLGDKGGIFTIFDDEGMGKSRALLSLLIMRHGRAPKFGLWFGGDNTSFASGDAYYDGLVNSTIGGKCEHLSRLIGPNRLAGALLDLVPPSLDDMDSTQSGWKSVPGLGDFLRKDLVASGNSYRRTGGLPVIVFEDVNIEGIRDNFQLQDLGKAHVFFDRLMTQAYSNGNIVFVLTKHAKVAKYFRRLNHGKSTVIFSSEAAIGNFPGAQVFEWNYDRRLEFVSLRDRKAAGRNRKPLPGSELQQLARLHPNIRCLANALDTSAYQHQDLNISLTASENKDPGCFEICSLM